MLRSPRIEFPGAVCHVLVCGARREPIVLGDDDRWMFLRTLGEMTKRTAICVHAAPILMEQTSVRQKWVVETLHMGSAPYVSRLAKLMGERIAQGDRGMWSLKNRIVKILS